MALATFEFPRLAISDMHGVRQAGHGAAVVTEHGRVSIKIAFPAPAPLLGQPWLSGELEVEGETSDGRTVKASRCYVEGTNWDSTLLEAEVRVSALDPILIEQAGAPSAWTTRKLHLKNIDASWPQMWTYAGLAFELRAMNRGIKVTERDRAGLVDFELTVGRQGQGQDGWDALRSPVLKLLSLAARSPCSAPIEETWNGAHLVCTTLRTSESDFHATHTLIPNDNLGLFMGAALPEYLANEAAVGLDTLVAYYCRSHTESMAEYKFLFSGVLMEALKFNWALNKRNLPTKKAGSGVVQKFLKPDGKTQFGFEELLNMVAADLGVVAKYTFIENRNAVFHTGEVAAAQAGGSGSIWPVLKPELVKLHDEIDDLLLSVLKYTGPITSYWDMGQPMQFPGRAPLP